MADAQRTTILLGDLALAPGGVAFDCCQGFARRSLAELAARPEVRATRKKSSETESTDPGL